MQVRIEHKGLNEVIKNTAPRILRRPIALMMRRVGAVIQREMVPEAPTGADSRLAGSIEANVGNQSPFPTDVRVGPTVQYGAPVALGRSPGTMPPWRVGSSLHRWVSLVMNVRNPDSVAFLVARSIARRGIDANPFHIRGLKKSAGGAGREFARAAREIARSVGRR